MSKEKQIEKMARVICKSSSNRGRCEDCGFFKNRNCNCFEEATDLYNAGYRKASEVARAIFEEIEGSIDAFASRDIDANTFYMLYRDVEKQFTEGE